MDALRAVTIDAAWQVFQEENRGSLEPGKYADLVVLSGNPRKPHGLARVEVEQTVVGGATITASAERFIAAGLDPRPIPI